MSTLLNSGCEPGGLFGPTLTPTPTATLTPTLTPRPTPTFTPTLTPTPTQTRTSTATPIPTKTPTKTLTPTVTPAPDQIATIITWEMLFSGPDYTFSYTNLGAGTRVRILAKVYGLTAVGCGLWYRVQVEGTNAVGWIECGSSTRTIDDDAVPVYKEDLPPTPPPTATVPLPLQVHITLVNPTKYAVEAKFWGPYKVDVTVPPNGTITVDLPAGYYDYSLESPGIVPKSGNAEWQAGHVDTWEITVK